MSLRDDLAGVLARDSRYTIQAYAFVFEALEHTRHLRRLARAKVRGRRARQASVSGHVTGRELCLGLRRSREARRDRRPPAQGPDAPLRLRRRPLGPDR